MNLVVSFNQISLFLSVFFRLLLLLLLPPPPLFFFFFLFVSFSLILFGCSEFFFLSRFSLFLSSTHYWWRVIGFSLHSTSCTLGGIFNLSYIETSNALLHLTNSLFSSLPFIEFGRQSLSRLCTRGLLLCETMFPFNQFVAAQYRYSKFGRCSVFFPLSIFASVSCSLISYFVVIDVYIYLCSVE